MRKLLIPVLLAGAAASPALAQPRNSPDSQQAREQRVEAREQARADRSADRADARPSFVAPPRPDRPAEVRQTNVQPQASAQAVGRADAQDIQAIREQRQQVRDDHAQARQDRADARDLRQSSRPLPNVMHPRTPVVSDTPRAGTQPPVPAEARPATAPKWSTDWRKNNKYDWYHWRRSHSWLFNLGFYYDPYGWGYQPYSIGWRLWPSYYSSRYWLNDPWQYRLPYAPPGYVWIRYWNDALLVDEFTGTVVDMIPNFFW